MLLTIAYPNTLLPFQLCGTKEDCLRAVEQNRQEGWDFHPHGIKITDTILHFYAKPKGEKATKQKRFYLYKDRILQQTPCNADDKINLIKEYLAHRNHCNPSDIRIFEI